LHVERAEAQPHVPGRLPTTGEAGIKGADARCGSGLGPAGMPADLVNKISGDIRKGARGPNGQREAAQRRQRPPGHVPQEFGRFVRSEMDEYQRVVKGAGIKPQ